ncbi:MAG: hypothetical protein GX602_05275 [Dehalococcoidales bacterium]|nr:hypothetical protein [Dehalococcoidales bacterium]
MHYFNNAYPRTDNYYSYEQIMREISLPTKRVVCWDVRQWKDFSLIEFHRE